MEGTWGCEEGQDVLGGDPVLSQQCRTDLDHTTTMEARVRFQAPRRKCSEFFSSRRFEAS
ncbi:hypothetical protein [Amycolatopsis sp. NPDC004079]|uniref:hypothetical protein n=1 Tax=Amycolatopsis sp. NPDC004079 TaxID=3154549 RepID=UPI0033AFA2DE